MQIRTDDPCMTAADVRAAAARAANRRRLYFGERRPARPRPIKARSPNGFDRDEYMAWRSKNSVVEIYKEIKRQILVRQIVDVAAKMFKMSADEICSESRKSQFVKVRDCIYWVARAITCKSFPSIGRLIGGRDHSTVIYGFEKVEASIASNGALGIMARSLRNAVLQKYSSPGDLVYKIEYGETFAFHVEASE